MPYLRHLQENLRVDGIRYVVNPFTHFKPSIKPVNRTGPDMAGLNRHIAAAQPLPRLKLLKWNSRIVWHPLEFIAANRSRNHCKSKFSYALHIGPCDRGE